MHGVHRSVKFLEKPKAYYAVALKIKISAAITIFSNGDFGRAEGASEWSHIKCFFVFSGFSGAIYM